MKIVVYLVMFLMIDPLVRLAGVALTGLYLMAMVALGVVLLVRGSGRRQNAPQQGAPPVVYGPIGYGPIGYGPVGYGPVVPGGGGPPVYVVAPTTPMAPPSAAWGATPSGWGVPPLAPPLARWFDQRPRELPAPRYRVPPGGAPLWVHEGKR